MAIKECVVCGGSFDARTPAKVCGGACRRERRKAQMKEWNSSDKGRLAQAEYRHKNREARAQKSREWREKNPDLVSENGKRRYYENIEECRRYARDRATQQRAAYRIINRIKEEGLSALL